MPQTIVLEDGTEKEVPTDEEIKELQEKASSAEKVGELEKELNTIKQEIDIKDGENLAEKLKEMKESANPNWPKTRQKIKSMEEALRAQGKEIDDDGKIIEKHNFDPDIVNQQINESVKEQTFNAEKERLMRGMSEDDKNKVNHYFNKLISGEDKNTENLYKFIGEAEKLAFPESNSASPLKQAISSTAGGGRPVSKEEKSGASDGAKEMGKTFGHNEEDFEKGGDVSDLIMNK